VRAFAAPDSEPDDRRRKKMRACVRRIGSWAAAAAPRSLRTRRAIAEPTRLPTSLPGTFDSSVPSLPTHELERPPFLFPVTTDNQAQNARIRPVALLKPSRRVETRIPTLVERGFQTTRWGTLAETDVALGWTSGEANDSDGGSYRHRSPL